MGVVVPREQTVTDGWRSKGPGDYSPTSLRSPGSTGIAHYILDGQPACGNMTFRDGRQALHPFKCSWVDLRHFDRKCTMCARRLRTDRTTDRLEP
jgi:hypothetical protein